MCTILKEATTNQNAIGKMVVKLLQKKGRTKQTSCLAGVNASVRDDKQMVPYRMYGYHVDFKTVCDTIRTLSKTLGFQFKIAEERVLLLLLENSKEEYDLDKFAPLSDNGVLGLSSCDGRSDDGELTFSVEGDETEELWRAAVELATWRLYKAIFLT